jgi:tripeptidyl-peptidase I
MVAFSLFFSLVSVVSLACAERMPDNFVVHERRDSIPQGYAHNGAAPHDELLSLRIGLVSNNMTGLEKALYDVSTPSSPMYGKHLSKKEVCQSSALICS